MKDPHDHRVVLINCAKMHPWIWGRSHQLIMRAHLQRQPRLVDATHRWSLAGQHRSRVQVPQAADRLSGTWATASSGTGSRCRSQYRPACRGPVGAAGSAGRSGQDRPMAYSVLFTAVVATTPARIALERRPGRTRSLMGLGLGFVECLRDLGEGVGEGLVPVHVRAAGAEFSRGLLAQGFRHDRADQPGRLRRLH
jgi:hypothetical protein